MIWLATFHCITDSNKNKNKNYPMYRNLNTSGSGHETLTYALGGGRVLARGLGLLPWGT